MLAGLAAGEEDAAKRLTELLERGRGGVAKIPGKRGGPAPDYAAVQVVIGDQPGELARLFDGGRRGGHQHRGRPDRALARPAGLAWRSCRPARRPPVSSSTALAAGGWPVASRP